MAATKGKKKGIRYKGSYIRNKIHYFFTYYNVDGRMVDCYIYKQVKRK